MKQLYLSLCISLLLTLPVSEAEALVPTSYLSSDQEFSLSNTLNKDSVEIRFLNVSPDQITLPGKSVLEKVENDPQFRHELQAIKDVDPHATSGVPKSILATLFLLGSVGMSKNLSSFFTNTKEIKKVKRTITIPKFTKKLVRTYVPTMHKVTRKVISFSPPALETQFKKGIEAIGTFLGRIERNKTKKRFSYQIRSLYKKWKKRKKGIAQKTRALKEIMQKFTSRLSKKDRKQFLALWRKNVMGKKVEKVTTHVKKMIRTKKWISVQNYSGKVRTRTIYENITINKLSAAKQRIALALNYLKNYPSIYTTPSNRTFGDALSLFRKNTPLGKLKKKHRRLTKLLSRHAKRKVKNSTYMREYNEFVKQMKAFAYKVRNSKKPAGLILGRTYSSRIEEFKRTMEVRRLEEQLARSARLEVSTQRALNPHSHKHWYRSRYEFHKKKARYARRSYLRIEKKMQRYIRDSKRRLASALNSIDRLSYIKNWDHYKSVIRKGERRIAANGKLMRNTSNVVLTPAKVTWPWQKEILAKKARLKAIHESDISRLETQTIAKTWDHHTNSRIKKLHPSVQLPATLFVNRVQKELGITLRIGDGYRSHAEQDALYNKVPKVTNAKGGQSYHNYGLAIDVYAIKWDKHGRQYVDWNVDMKKVAKIGKSLGFEWGGDWKSFPDKPHFEMRLGNTWQDLKEKYNESNYRLIPNLLKK